MGFSVPAGVAWKWQAGSPAPADASFGVVGEAQRQRLRGGRYGRDRWRVAPVARSRAAERLALVTAVLEVLDVGSAVPSSS
jgi:hypothetical protein